jgi:hypothetical protein
MKTAIGLCLLLGSVVALAGCDAPNITAPSSLGGVQAAPRVNIDDGYGNFGGGG